MEENIAKGYALDALIWLTKDAQNLESFLTSSGGNTQYLRKVSKDPEFLSFVLDYIVKSDELILGLSKELSISPDKIQLARAILSDGDLYHWT